MLWRTKQKRVESTHIQNNGCLRLGVVRTDIDDNTHTQTTNTGVRSPTLPPTHNQEIASRHASVRSRPLPHLLQRDPNRDRCRLAVHVYVMYRASTVAPQTGRSADLGLYKAAPHTHSRSGHCSASRFFVTRSATCLSKNLVYLRTLSIRR
jgi:hypothetical protein